MATIGTIMALMLNTHLSLLGWMKMKGSWRSQKRKNERKSDEVAPWASGTRFGKRLYWGQMAAIMRVTNWPPDHELIESLKHAMTQRDCRQHAAISRSAVLPASALRPPHKLTKTTNLLPQ
jgi:hypothetical protein